jgi:hypothetical protein
VYGYEIEDSGYGSKYSDRDSSKWSSDTYGSRTEDRYGSKYSDRYDSQTDPYSNPRDVSKESSRYLEDTQ